MVRLSKILGNHPEIPSLADDVPYADFELEEGTLIEDYSDGVPELLDDRQTLPHRPTRPPRGSEMVTDFDHTQPLRTPHNRRKADR